MAVHAYGRIELISDRDQLQALMRRTAEVSESAMPAPWSMPEESTPFEERLLDQIVGFRIPLESIREKWKLSQNHPLERREKSIVPLRQQGDADSLAIAQLMEAGPTAGSINPLSEGDREGINAMSGYSAYSDPVKLVKSFETKAHRLAGLDS